MAMRIRAQQPMLWSSIYLLVTGDNSAGDEEPIGGRDTDEDLEGEEIVDNNSESEDEMVNDKRLWAYMCGSQPRAFKEIKTITILSQLLHSRYRKCNTLQSVMGVFLHSCNTPEKVVKVLTRMGISVSLTSIHCAIHSLKSECFMDIRKLGHTLLVSYAYDNFNVKFSTGILTVEGLQDTLVHLTSGTLIRLKHGVPTHDLRCGSELWEKNPNNPNTSNPIHFHPHTTMKFLYMLQFEAHTFEAPRTRLTRQGLFRTYYVEQIPICSVHQVPLQAMRINQSTVSGNIDALMDMLAQAGVGDADAVGETSANMTDLGDIVQLIHSNLGTMEQVLSAMERRAINLTPTAQLQFVVFVFGLFHFKMVAADAIWHIPVSPDSARKDATSFMAFINKLRPASSGKLTNNASFRKQHELIKSCGRARRYGYLTLDKWAEAKLTLEVIEKFAEQLVTQYVKGKGTNLYQMKNRSAVQHDKQHKNTMRTHHYLLLYEEVLYSMNKGDIGRLEMMFLPWIQIFRAVGKHKYANRMLLFMHQLYNVYPDSLRCAVQYNMLVNLTGCAHHFRAVEWVVELLNLFIKEMYGGKGSNYTTTRIVDESALILIYRNTHNIFEQYFLLSGLSYAHTTKNMTATFSEVQQYIQSLEESTNKYHAGREAKYKVPNALDCGEAIIALESAVTCKDETMVDSDKQQMWDEIEREGGSGVGDKGYWGLTNMVSAQDLAAEGAL
ncbi:hypothetical protein BC835DRAFT_1403706 [Cytidiella melzeri]|nr:hypothetical protein BC835DRAFT_1403706 [Cytidiella melzeri]